MNDHLLVEALRERDPGAPAAVYDAHAHRLYAYCWFQLRCRDTAQVALRDTFIVAEAHIGRLRDPNRFGPWLYAIARLECARRLTPRDQAPDLAVATHDQEDVDQRLTAWRAVLGLRPVSREILELRVRHRLSLSDLAAVFGMSPRDAQEALDRAHGELEEALTAEVLAQQGPYGCAERARLLRERRSELTPDLSGRLMEHAGTCSACGAFRPRSVSAAKVYGLLPDARPAAELRLRVMSCFLDPELVGYRLFVATRVTEFTPDGFPSQALRTGRQGGSGAFSWLGRIRRTRPVTKEAGLGAQAVRAAIVLAVVGLLSGGGVASMYGLIGAGRKPAGTVAGPHPTAVPGVSQVPESGRPGARPQTGPENLDAAPVSATLPLGARASSAPPAAAPTPPPVPVSGTESTAATGILDVTPHFLDLAGGSDGSMELRAEGGAVAWHAKSRGSIQVQPSSGRLRAGQAVTVRVHVARRPDAHGDGTITFQPGDTQVHVTWRQDVPAPGPTPAPTGSSPATPSTPPEAQRPGGSHPTPPPSSPAPATTPPSSGGPEPTPSSAERPSGATPSAGGASPTPAA